MVRIRHGVSFQCARNWEAVEALNRNVGLRIRGLQLSLKFGVEDLKHPEPSTPGPKPYKLSIMMPRGEAKCKQVKMLHSNIQYSQHTTACRNKNIQNQGAGWAGGILPWNPGKLLQADWPSSF